MILLKLFLAFLKIGAFSFGGGYAMIPFIEKEIISANHWINLVDFTNIIAISQMTPGPIAINSATFVGYKINSVLGSTVATTGVVLPSFIIATFVSKYFFKFRDSAVVKRAFEGIRPVVLALIISAAYSVGKTSYGSIIDVIISAAMFFLLLKFKLHPMLIILISGVLGVILY